MSGPCLRMFFFDLIRPSCGVVEADAFYARQVLIEEAFALSIEIVLGHVCSSNMPDIPQLRTGL